jgi:hypothetical protein
MLFLFRFFGSISPSFFEVNKKKAQKFKYNEIFEETVLQIDLARYVAHK